MQKNSAAKFGMILRQKYFILAISLAEGCAKFGVRLRALGLNGHKNRIFHQQFNSPFSSPN
jgi:hypothetical protein